MIQKLEKIEIEEIKNIDKVLYDELIEINEFEGDLISLEYELNEEENLLARLHNLSRVMVLVIKQIHIINGLLKKDKTGKLINIHKKMLDRQMFHVVSTKEELLDILKKFESDEKAGQKISKYCNNVLLIIDKKSKELQKRIKTLEKEL